MALLGVILGLELSPMVALGGWRRGVASGERPDTRRAARFARISFLRLVWWC